MCDEVTAPQGQARSRGVGVVWHGYAKYDRGVWLWVSRRLVDVKICHDQTDRVKSDAGTNASSLLCFIPVFSIL